MGMINKVDKNSNSIQTKAECKLGQQKIMAREWRKAVDERKQRVGDSQSDINKCLTV